MTSPLTTSFTLSVSVMEENSGAQSAVFKLLAEERQETFKIDSSDILSRLQTFLPQLDKANSLLSDMDEKDINIEEVEDGDQHIEMNVGLFPVEDDENDNILDENDLPSDSDDEDIVIIKTPPTPRKELIVDMDVSR